MISGLQYYEEKFQVLSEHAIKPGLQSMEQALARLGNPHKNVRFVHLAGTNGKGSTLTFVESLALEHGLQVGAFLSPAIVDVHDQLRINGKPITMEQMNAVFERLQKAKISGICTEFELLTCAAFVFFEQQQVDVAIVEAGMGGRFDSTNVLQPIVSIIPSIALEHTNFLGSTLVDIAKHKAGIIKPNAPVVVGTVDDEALDVIKNEALLTGSSVDLINEDFHLRDDIYRDEQVQFAPITLTMRGHHQLNNAALAIRAFSYIHNDVQIEKVITALKKAQLPFRFERMAQSLYFDGAHNPASARALVETIKKELADKDIHFVVGMLADKDVDAVLRTLEEVSNNFTFVQFNNERAMSAKELLERSQASSTNIVDNVVDFLIEKSEQQVVTIVTGSLYLLASIRQQFISRVE